METIIAAVISGGVTLIICMINNHAQGEKTRALIDYRLQQLERKQDKHNTLIERMYEIEGEVKTIKNDIRVANHRISDLEENNKQTHD